MIANALTDKPLPFYGEGLNLRDWLYVEDYFVIRNGKVGEVYNVGGRNEKQNIEIVKIICKELSWLPKPSLRTESRRPSSGTSITANGGRSSSAVSTRTATIRCTATIK